MITFQTRPGDDGVGAATCGIITTGSVMRIDITSGGSGYIESTKYLV